MVDFLTHVQDLHREVGAAGVAPTSVIDQVGEANRLVNWIKQSDVYIQTLWTRWEFMRAEFNQAIILDDQVVGGQPTDLKQWDIPTFFLDGDPLTVVHYDKVKSEFYDTTIVDIPTRLIIMPNKTLRIDPVSNGPFTVTADYYITPVIMENNVDVSIIPEEFHQAILGRAIILYSNFEDAPEAKEHGAEIYAEALARLQDDQIPNEDNAGYKGSGGFFEVIAE